MSLENLLIGAITTGVTVLIVLAIVALVRFLRTQRGAVETSVGDLLVDFPQLKSFLDEAAKYAANIIERLDREGYFDDFKDKAQGKLNEAVEIAVDRLEEWFGDYGLEIDIPESLITDIIQRYVWENPDLFPTRSASREGGVPDTNQPHSKA